MHVKLCSCKCSGEQACIYVATTAHSHCSHRHVGAAPAQAEAGAEAGEAQGTGPASPAEEDRSPVRAALNAAADAL